MTLALLGETRQDKIIPAVSPDCPVKHAKHAAHQDLPSPLSVSLLMPPEPYFSFLGSLQRSPPSECSPSIDECEGPWVTCFGVYLSMCPIQSLLGMLRPVGRRMSQGSDASGGVQTFRCHPQTQSTNVCAILNTNLVASSMFTLFLDQRVRR